MMPLPGAARIWAWVLVAGAQLAPSTSQAQQGAQADQLAEVVVTARKRAEPLQSVPVAVSALGGEVLEQRDLRSAVDLTASIPNLQTPLNPVMFSAALASRREREPMVISACPEAPPGSAWRGTKRTAPLVELRP